MTNFQVYRKTLSFSFLMFAIDLGAIAILFGFPILAYVIMSKSSVEYIVAGMIVGFLLGIIAVSLINIFITNRVKAAQIAMMVKGVNEGVLPEHTFKAGFEEVRGRFAKITVFFFITNAIRSIFRQIGRGVNKIGTALGGDTGNAITSAIDSAIQTLIAYLCDCCLGWILFRDDINPFKAGCEGCVIFFKHGKTLIRNIGRIFGMGFLSFLVIGGGLTGLGYLIFSQFPSFFANMLQSMAESGSEVPTDNVQIFMLIVAAVLAIALWTALHSVLVRPFILVGVLRNFMVAGKEHIPSEAEFNEVARMAPRFSKLQDRA